MKLTLNEDTIYNENDIIDAIKELNSSISETKIKWILFEMEKENKITRIGTKKYITNGNSYTYNYESDIAIKLDSFLTDNFSQVKSIIFETKQLNEWSNFLISQNIIIVEVELGFESIVFDKLMESFGDKYTILLSPSDEMISRYLRDELIIVRTLYSRSPIKRKSHIITLEKLIVDCIADKYFNKLLGTYGTEYLIGVIKSNYTINESKMFTYAKRRKKDIELNDLWVRL